MRTKAINWQVLLYHSIFLEANMKRIYLDNAATSFPKAPGVAQAVYDYLTSVGSNINRGAYQEALEAEEVVYDTRELLAEFFGCSQLENVVFTKNITESLNLTIRGLLKLGDHIITTSMEHNAVLRPLNHLKINYNDSLDVSILPCDQYGDLPRGQALDTLLTNHLTPRTKAIIMTHASNVSGTILPLQEVSSFCHRHNLFFIIDTAQTAGILDYSFGDLKADAIAFTGHKGLLGPQGIGGVVLSTKLSSILEPLITGGTGASSEDDLQPVHLPDRFEAGTLNLPGIYGLNSSLNYLKELHIKTIMDKELSLTESFLNGIHSIKGVKLIGPSSLSHRTAVVSLDFPNMDNALLSHKLASVFGITNRCGLHCAPLAHKTLGTFPEGTVRFSFSHFNTQDDVDYTLKAIKQCLQEG